MAHTILATTTASISELKRNPMATVSAGEGLPVAILNRNKPNFAPKLVKVLLMCRIGRGLSYCNGVSPRGKSYYDRLIGLLGDQFAPIALAAFTQYEIQAKLESEIARQQACQALTTLKAGVVNQRLVECIDFLIVNLPGTGKVVFDSRFKALSAGYITW